MLRENLAWLSTLQASSAALNSKILFHLANPDTNDVDAITGSEKYWSLEKLKKSALLAEIGFRGDKYKLRSAEVAEVLPLADFQFSLVNAAVSMGLLFCKYLLLP